MMFKLPEYVDTSVQAIYSDHKLVDSIKSQISVSDSYDDPNYDWNSDPLY